jgi:hypothetical protein
VTVAELLKRLSGGPTSSVRAAAAEALQRAGADSPDVALRLAQALDDPARVVRLRAGLALRSLPPQAVEPALGILSRLCSSRSDDVVDEATRTLVRVGLERPTSVEAVLAPLLEGGGRAVRATAASVLAQLGRVDPAWASDAFTWLADADGWTRACGAHVLARLDLPARARVALVVAALATARGDVVGVVREARSRLALDPDELRARIDAGPPRERAVALLLLQRRTRAEPSDGELDRLRRALVRVQTCELAADALRWKLTTLPSSAEEVAAVVAEALWSKHPAVQAAAARCLDWFDVTRSDDAGERP